MSKVGEVLKGLSSGDLREFLAESSTLGDELSRQLIKKIGGLHSPMTVANLPIEGFPRDETLVRLYDLEKMGIFRSRLEKKNRHDYIRVFRATALGKRIAQAIPSKS